MGYKKINIDFFTSLGQVYCPPLTITYDSTGRLTKEAVTGSNGEFNIGYTYDNAGNRIAITGAVNKTYSYDANNRLLSETASYNTVQYTYDNNGNQTKKETCRLNSDGTKTVSQTENFAYNGLNQLVNYDSSNVTAVNNKSASYKYMANGYRLSKTLNYTKAFVGAVTEETRYLWDKDNIVEFMDSSNDVTHKYYRGYNLICNGEGKYYMHDPHGNVIETYKPNQTTPYDKYFYNAFGTQNGFEDTDMIERSNEWGYCDQLYDGFATGNYYMRAREYNPNIGRFITEDPIRNGSNWYNYCSGNPLMYKDSSGLVSESEAEEIILRNATTIKMAGNKFGVNPAIIAGCIYTEQITNVSISDAIVDPMASQFGIDVSLGIGQVRLSTAEKVERNGYMPKITVDDTQISNGEESILINQENSIRAQMLMDDETNIMYVAAYLRYIQDLWKDAYPIIDGKSDILGTLYNIGENGKYGPNSNPESNSFGNTVKANYNKMKKLLGLS